MIVTFLIVIVVAAAAVVGTIIFIRDNPAKSAAVNSGITTVKGVAAGLLAQK